MERKMGFEPTASSLGISASIAYKGHGVHSGDTDPWRFSNLLPLLHLRPLNGVEMEWKNSLRGVSPPSMVSGRTHLEKHSYVWREAHNRLGKTSPLPAYRPIKNARVQSSCVANRLNPIVPFVITRCLQIQENQHLPRFCTQTSAQMW